MPDLLKCFKRYVPQVKLSDLKLPHICFSVYCSQLMICLFSKITFDMMICSVRFRRSCLNVCQKFTYIWKRCEIHPRKRQIFWCHLNVHNSHKSRVKLTKLRKCSKNIFVLHHPHTFLQFYLLSSLNIMNFVVNNYS